MRRRRKPRLRKPKKLLYIICEGKTEVNYFSGLFNSKPSNREFYHSTIYQPKDHSPLGIVNEAIEEKMSAKTNKIPSSDLIIWGVFDKDCHNNLPEAFNKARNKRIEIAFSSISFEYWILLHYTTTTKAFHDCWELIKYIKRHYDQNYDKRNDHYNQLKEKTDDAIENGKWLRNQVVSSMSFSGSIFDESPYTDVHELVIVLISL